MELISKIVQSLSNPPVAKTSQSAENGRNDMKNSLASIPTQRIARGLVLTFAATAACTFFSACFGTAYRHEARVENRVDRRMERRSERWNY
jgi:hypothetical protein